MSRPPLNTYARHILRFGSRRAELGILLLSALNVALLLALFGVLTSIAGQLAFEGAEGPRGFVPEFVAALPLPTLMALALATLALSFLVSLSLRLFITSEAYRMFERATVAAFDAMRRESRISDAHVREYPTLLKNSVRFMSMAYMQGIALLFPVFLVVGIVAFGLFVQPVLTLAIAGAALVSIPIFLWQSQRGQLNSERLAKTLVTRSAHLNRYVANLLRHPSRDVADRLDVRGYLDGEEGRAFRRSYVHRQRVGEFSTAVGTLGTLLGLAAVFAVLLFGPDGWFNLTGLVLAVLMFRVLESNFGTIMKLLGNMRATVPFTTAAVNLFEREREGFPGAGPLAVADTEPDLPPHSPLGAMVLCDLPWAREAATRIARAVEAARGTDRPVFALAGDFDLVRGRVGDELQPIDAPPKILYPFDTLARAADFLELPPEKRTQDAWEHLSPKGRFVIACLAERERLADHELVLALNASDVSLLNSEERDVLPWVFDRRGTVLLFESIPPATRLPDGLDLLSYDGRRLRRHGTVADYHGVVDGIYGELVLGLGGNKEGAGDDMLALEDLDELGVDDSPADGEEREDGTVSPRLRVGYAPELETTVWYERWLMVRGQHVLPRRGSGGGGDANGSGGPLPPDPHMSTFGLTSKGRQAAAAAERAGRERLEAARLAERESNREEAAAARDRLRTAEEAAHAAKARAERTDAALRNTNSRLADAKARRDAAEAKVQNLEAELKELRRKQATAEHLADREAGRSELRKASRDKALIETRAARDDALKVRNALQRELDAERKARARAEVTHGRALSDRDKKVAAARADTKSRTSQHRTELREHKRETAAIRRERDRLAARVEVLEARLRGWEG